MPDKRNHGDIQTIRSLIPIIVIGFTLVLVALLLLLWPTGQFGQANVDRIPHLRRIFSPMLGESAMNIPRRILDVAIYLVVLIGIGFLVVAWRRGTRNSLLGLIGISILGLSYVSGMALYTGPAVGTCGFLLILFGAMVVWATLPRDDEDADSATDANGQGDENGEARPGEPFTAYTQDDSKAYSQVTETEPDPADRTDKQL